MTLNPVLSATQNFMAADHVRKTAEMTPTNAHPVLVYMARLLQLGFTVETVQIEQNEMGILRRSILDMSTVQRLVDPPGR